MIIPWQDYQKLVDSYEMLQDIAAYDEARAAIEQGEELVPSEVMYAIVNREHPLMESIRKQDLSHFHIECVRLNDCRLRFDPPLLIEPQLVEHNQLIALIDDELGIDVVAPTIEELAEDLQSEIKMLWVTYAMEEDSALSPKALALKHRLLHRIRKEEQDGETLC